MPVPPALLPGNEQAWDIWQLVSDQVIMLPKVKKVKGRPVTVNVPHLHVGTAAKVVTLAGLAGDDALWTLCKLKVIDRIIHGH